MLCDKCSSLPLADSTSDWDVQHYSTFSQLTTSARGGCKICALLKTALLEYFAKGLGLSVEEAEQYHQQLDEYPEKGGNERFRLREDELNGPEFRDSAFFVESVLSGGSETELRGLQGIIFARFTAGYYTPVEEVYPFIHVSSLPYSIPLHEWYVAGRGMSATADISLAQHWLLDCDAGHPSCHSLLSTKLPYRILDLGLSDGSSDLTLRIGVDSPARYATLSHCWGASQPLKLEQRTCSAFQNKITYSELPRTFRDAVSVTRSLGLRYLWIDSLCIIQDSQQDWEEQCIEMKRIYRDSYVTLAGAASSGCDDGFLHPRPTSYDVTIELSRSNSRCQLVLSYHGVVEDPYFQMPEPDSPLLKRAWILQERLLARRTLYFGTDKMYLECFTNVRFDNLHHPCQWHFRDTDTVTKHDFARLGSSTDPFQQWGIILKAYSGLHLTKVTDRLPALSGLASHFQSATGVQYLAGLWREDIPRALGWYVPFWELESPVFPPSTTYIAPSWSWASAAFRITDNTSSNGPFRNDADITNCRVTPAGIDPFGAVKDGFIDMSGRVRRGLVEERPDTFVPERQSLFLLSGDPGSSAIGTYAPDYPIDVSSGGFSVLLLHLGTDSRGNSTAISLKEVVGEPGTYRRVGLALSEGPEFPELFKGIKKTAIRVI